MPEEKQLKGRESHESDLLYQHRQKGQKQHLQQQKQHHLSSYTQSAQETATFEQDKQRNVQLNLNKLP